MKEKAGVMKTMRKMAIVGCVACLSAGSALATDWHVATNGNDAADGTTWATAKLTIQAAVDAAGDGDTVWASNGVYATGGGRVVVGTWPNRVAIDKPITLQSANGPETTFIVGAGMRCAYVTNGATLSGFTLTNGATALKMGPFDPGTVDHNGGGAACEGGAVLTNCVLAGNWACERGGGSSGGLLDNCTLTGNSAWNAGGGSDGGMLNHCALVNNHADTAGGGSLGGTLNDCTLAGNSSSYGGGAIGSALNDCILQDNSGGTEGGGVFGGTLNRCVLSGNRSLKGGGAARDAILNDCLLTGNEASETEEGMRGGGGAHGCVLRNCTVADNSAHEGGGVFNCTVLNGIVWGNAAPYSPDWIGGAFTNSCTAPHPGGTGNIANDPRFEDAQAGNFRLHFASPCIDGGANTLVAGTTDLNGNARIANGTVDMGAYEHWRLYVATNGSDGASGISWAAPKQTVQAAIDAAAPNGGTVWVSNGVYETGGRAVGIGEVTNRVAIDRSITVRSVNGADVTVIRGQNMGGRIRCVYVGSHAVLSGFALVNGLAVGYATNNAGGGVFVAGGTVANCLIGGNNAPEGGGAYIADAGTLSHCRLIGNSAGSAGAGGGVFSSSGGRLQNCLISDNFAEWAPGVYVRGGGLELVNCTISGNSSFGGPAVVAPTSTLWNCIVHGNNVETNHLEIEGIPAAMHCCSPGLAGAGNVTNDPAVRRCGGGRLPVAGDLAVHRRRRQGHRRLGRGFGRHPTHPVWRGGHGRLRGAVAGTRRLVRGHHERVDERPGLRGGRRGAQSAEVRHERQSADFRRTDAHDLGFGQRSADAAVQPKPERDGHHADRRGRGGDLERRGVAGAGDQYQRLLGRGGERERERYRESGGRHGRGPRAAIDQSLPAPEGDPAVAGGAGRLSSRACRGISA